MDIFVIESGSKGNATIIGNGKEALLIDMGVSLKCLKKELASTPYRFEDIKVCLFTHNHSDHIKSIDQIDEDIIYCGKGTIPIEKYHVLTPYRKKVICGFEITPLMTSHDAPNSLGYIIRFDGKTLAYMTDTGYISAKNIGYMKDLNYYIIESNHNIRMLLQTSRPASLKKRIMSDYGHLSNEDSALFMSQLIGPNTEEIILAHLSEEANTPELALATYYRILRKQNIDVNRLKIHTAFQYLMVKGGSAYEN